MKSMILQLYVTSEIDGDGFCTAVQFFQCGGPHAHTPVAKAVTTVVGRQLGGVVKIAKWC